MSDKVYYVNMHTLAWCSTQSLLAEPQHFLAEPTEKGFHTVCVLCVLFEKNQQTHGPTH